MTNESPSPRQIVVEALARQAQAYPDLGPVHFDLPTLSLRDRAWASHLYCSTVQHWLTLRYLLNTCLTKKKMDRLEPMMQAILLAGGLQLLMPAHTPAYAAVNESVTVARLLMRREAGGLVNAVLRRFARLVDGFDAAANWTPASDALPIEGGVLKFARPMLPPPGDTARYLSLATSHPQPMVEDWLKQWSVAQVTQLCLHNNGSPPRMVVDEHEHSHIWTEDHEALREYLAANPHRRVQDPTAAEPIREAIKQIHERQGVLHSVLDYCAGNGTKSRQLACLLPKARITACDVSRERAKNLKTLQSVFPEQLQVISPDAARENRYDMLVLDVPCSNTGVLARRVEARYRRRAKVLDELVRLQREILSQTLGCVRPGGWLLYSTCSIEACENEQQIDWLAGQAIFEQICSRRTLPSNPDAPYHDGGFYALVQVKM